MLWCRVGTRLGRQSNSVKLCTLIQHQCDVVAPQDTLDSGITSLRADSLSIDQSDGASSSLPSATHSNNDAAIHSAAWRRQSATDGLPGSAVSGDDDDDTGRRSAEDVSELVSDDNTDHDRPSGCDSSAYQCDSQQPTPPVDDTLTRNSAIDTCSQSECMSPDTIDAPLPRSIDNSRAQGGYSDVRDKESPCAEYTVVDSQADDRSLDCPTHDLDQLIFQDPVFMFNYLTEAFRELDEIMNRVRDISLAV